MTATTSARVRVTRTAADAGTFSNGGVVASSSCQAPPSGSLHTRRSLRALGRVVALAQGSEWPQHHADSGRPAAPSH